MRPIVGKGPPQTHGIGLCQIASQFLDDGIHSRVGLGLSLIGDGDEVSGELRHGELSSKRRGVCPDQRAGELVRYAYLRRTRRR